MAELIIRGGLAQQLCELRNGQTELMHGSEKELQIELDIPVGRSVGGSPALPARAFQPSEVLNVVRDATRLLHNNRLMNLGRRTSARPASRRSCRPVHCRA